MKHILLIVTIIGLLVVGCNVNADEPIPKTTQAYMSALDPDADGILNEANNPDNCPDIFNTTQADSDGDDIGDACDTCPNDPANDVDSDGICGDIDNCPFTVNTDQTDTDSDGTGDVCDDCLDMDSDLICDNSDNYLATLNTAQADLYEDGIGDVGDVCQDEDSDEICSNIDNCPVAANTDQTDTDSDGIGDVCDDCLDMDSDLVCDNSDNCPDTLNTDQADLDEDGIGDACDDCVDEDSDEVCGNLDNCPNLANKDQTDSDHDGIGDVCDVCPKDASNDLDADGICGDQDTCASDPDNDKDGDGICGNVDNCPSTANPYQEDADGDRVGDSCDGCVDMDLDFVCNNLDNCPDTPNTAQEDADGDGIGDTCDSCPSDPNKFYPGYCGCGTPDTDADKDGIADCNDTYPNDPYNDSDNDGVCGNVDNCPVNANPDQADSNSNGIGDACEVVFETAYETDVFRLYPIGDYQKNIPLTGPLFHAMHWDLVDDDTPDEMATEVVSLSQLGAWSSDIYTHGLDEHDYPEGAITRVTEYVRVHTSGLQHAWAKFLFDDAQLGIQEFTVPEFDKNFTTFSHDFTSLRNNWSWDDIKNCRFGISLRGGLLQGSSCTQVYLEVEYRTTTYSEPQQPISTNCPNDPYYDADGDGVCGDIDNCPASYNPYQTDIDGDGIGDECDGCLDEDLDLVCDNLDNCPGTPNGNQADSNHDGIGDVCDSCLDADSDSICNNLDNCPNTSNLDQTDSDHDGIGDLCDVCPFDANNTVNADGTCGDIETCPNDADNDGLCDNEDNCPDTPNPNQTDRDNDGIGDLCDVCPFDANNTVNADGTCGDIETCPNDTDSDGLCDEVDNCPNTANLDQTDSDSDGIGDTCDVCPFDTNNNVNADGTCGDIEACLYDTDSDGLCDDEDNCPNIPNSNQADSNSDGIGDACSSSGPYSWSYNVTYSNDPQIATKTSAWTFSSNSTESVGGIDCHFATVDFSTPQERTYHLAPMNMDVKGTINEYATWQSIDDRDLTKENMQCSITVLFFSKFELSIPKGYSYIGNHGFPFTQGNSWTYTTTIDMPEYMYQEEQTWNAQVTAIETITVPAGTFDCYKVVHTSEGSTKTQWWSVDGQFICPVKYIDNATFVGTQTFDLVSYASN